LLRARPAYTLPRFIMLNFSDLSLRRGKRVLFAGASFNLFRGEKVGITGENGSGKSSLLALVRGELAPEAGSFEMPRQLAVAHVSQELQPSARAAIDFVLDGDPELRSAEAELCAAQLGEDGERLAELHVRYGAIGGYDSVSRAGALMHGLGFTASDEQRPVSAFSGGWRVRLNVAQALMCRSDLLLLDEPTNHLDLDAIIWLEGWLLAYPGTLLLISHDREFLDRITDRIVNIEHGRARAYRGNYSQFEQQRASELAEQASLHARQQREIKHMEAFVERFRAKATKARQAQSRLKALERMQRIAPAHVDSTFEFSFARPDRLPRPLLTLERQAVGYDGRVVVKALSFTIAPADRVALLGRNGAGKSTIMKLLAGELVASSGTRTEARDLRIGYFAQHQLEQLEPDKSPYLHLRRISEDRADRATDQQLRDFLGSFGFSGDRVFEPIAPFSGGEKARLVLALLTYQRPNLLLLDEPTNHLDLEMRQALAVALQEYEGAVILVSHDRHLLRVVADQLMLVDQGVLSEFDGDLEDYARWLGTGDAAAPPPAKAPVTGVPPESAEGRKAYRRLEAERRKALSPLRAQIAQTERELAQLLAERIRVEQELSVRATADSDRERLTRLAQEQVRLSRRIVEVESAWIAASEQLEARAAEQQGVD
jgi:ATP-binding cassette subfamily F protein 3